MVQLSSATSPFGGNLTRTGKGTGLDKIKMPSSQRQYFTMPINRPGGSTTSRNLPADALVTSAEIIVSDAGSATGSDKMRFRVGGVECGQIVMGTTGPRKFGWTANDLDASDTDTEVLGSTSVFSGLSSTHTVSFSFAAGSIANCKTATAIAIVEYVQTGVGIQGLDS
jgi:hypothetical protein